MTDQPLRDPLALAMLAAWMNVRPDQIPAANRAHTCPLTMAAWGRVAAAAEAAVAARLAARWRDAMADWDAGGEAALVEMDACIDGAPPHAIAATAAVTEAARILRQIVFQCDQGGEDGKVFARDACIGDARKFLQSVNGGTIRP